MPLDRYVTNQAEADTVSDFRGGYVEKYHKLIVDSCQIDTESTVVDIPCGSGDMARAIEVKADPHQLILMDINEEMVAAAKKKLSGDNIFIVSPGGNIGEVVKSTVDSIYCLNGFHQYIEEKEDFVNGCYKILKESGRLLFDVSTRGLSDDYTQHFFAKQEEYLHRFAKEHDTSVNLPGWPDKALLEKYTALTEEAGFSLVEVKQFQDWSDPESVYESATKIAGRSRPWLPGLEFKKRKEAFRTGIDSIVEDIGDNPIEHNRLFFVLEK